MPRPTVAVEVELSGVGGGWTDLAEAGNKDVLVEDQISIQHGINGGGPLDLVASIGRCKFFLDNSNRNSGAVAGYYSLHHASKRAGWGLNIGCRVRLTDPATLTVHTMFVGKISRIIPDPGIYGQRRVEVEAVDWIDEASRWAITADIPAQVNKRGDELVSTIVAAMPVAPTSTSYDTGVDTYAYALDVARIGSSPALAEFARIAQSGLDLIYVKADGTLRFENRHSRILDPTVDWAITGSTLASPDGVEVPSTREDIFNTIRVTVHTKLVDAEATSVVYEQANVIPIPSGETKTLIGPYRDQETGDTIGAVDVVDPVATTDYLANDAIDGTGTDRTVDVTVALSAGASGASIDVTNNHSATVYLTFLQLRGKRVMDRATEQREERDATSVAAYGEHVLAIDMPYQGNGDVAAGAADFLKNRYKDPIELSKVVRVLSRDAATLTKMLTTDVSARVSVSETQTGLSSEHFVNGITLTIHESVMEAKYVMAPADDPYGGSFFVIDTSALDGPDVLVPF